MSRSRAPTVAQLKEQLSRYGLSTSGRKAELEARIAEYREQQSKELLQMPEMAVAGPSLQRMPRNISENISRFAGRDLFYFSDKMALSHQLNDIQGLKTGIYPTTLEWSVDRVQNVQTINVTTKSDLMRRITEILATPNLKTLILKRDHLTVRLTFSSRLEVQVLLFYPGIQAHAYQIRIHGSTRYDPSIPPSKPYLFDYIQLSRNFNIKWSLVQSSMEDTKKAIKDVLLGIHWIQIFVLPNKAQLNPLITDDNIRYVSSGSLPEKDPLKDDVVDIRKFFISQINKVLPKSRRRGI